MKIKNDKLIIQIICVLIAIGLWVLVMVDENPMNTNTYSKIPVKIDNIEVLNRGNKTYELMDKIDSFNVNVKVRGLKNDLLKLEHKSIKATAKLTQFKEGANSVLVEIDIPSNMEVVEVSPKYLTLNIEEVVSVSVNVQVFYTGSQAKGYYIAYSSSNPDTVIVKGPRSVVNSVNKAVATINVEGKSGNVVQNVPVRLFNNTDKEISSLFISPSNVEASWEILPTKVVPVKPSYIGVPAEGYKLTKITSDVETVTIAGPRDLLDTIHELKTEPIDITNANINVKSDKIIEADERLIIVESPYEVKRISVTANIERIVDMEYTFDFDEIEFINLPTDYFITPFDKDTVFKVNVKAVSSIISKLDKKDIKLVVDAANAAEGENELSMNVSTDFEVESIISDTQSVKFNLNKNEETTTP